MTASLETDLKVVDYVLKRPFSDETFRLLLEATEADHRRVSAPMYPFEPLCRFSFREVTEVRLARFLLSCKSK